MKNDEKLRAGILGGTMVGERFISTRRGNHPWFSGDHCCQPSFLTRDYEEAVGDHWKDDHSHAFEAEKRKIDDHRCQ